MIVRMKRLTILCALADRDAALHGLRELGVLHVTHVRGPEGGDLEQARVRRSHLRRNLELIPPAPGVPGSGCGADEAIESIWSAAQELKALEEERESLEREQQRLAPIGSFDPAAAAALEKDGVWVRLYHVAAGRTPDVPAGAAAVPLCRRREGAVWAVFSQNSLVPC